MVPRSRRARAWCLWAAIALSSAGSTTACAALLNVDEVSYPRDAAAGFDSNGSGLDGGATDASSPEGATGPDGGAPSDASADREWGGTILCNQLPTLRCEAGASICCFRYSEDTDYCAAPASACTATVGNAIPVECDDDIDCRPGNVCCALTQSPVPVDASWDSYYDAIKCLPSCPATGFRMCSIDHLECPAPKQCAADPSTGTLRRCQ